MNELTRIPTFVDGLDAVLDGGIPQGHIIMVRGQPGTMKSTLTYHILHSNAAKDGLSGAYVSLEQSEQSFTDHIRQLGYDDLAQAGRIQFLGAPTF